MSSLPDINVDNLIDRILAVGVAGGRLTKQVSEAELWKLCVMAHEVFKNQSTLIEIEPPVVICGDIHGQYSDLLRIYDTNGFPPMKNYLFLGDYIDRGKQNLETIALQFCYKVKYPENFFILRGNHETCQVNFAYGFFAEVARRYTPRLWNIFQLAFEWMPYCALVGGRILCMHGGLSPQLNDLDQLRFLRRPIEPPKPSLELDLLWSDPDHYNMGWVPNLRGASYSFGKDVCTQMCQQLNIDLVARAHQVVQDGYEFFANRRLVTVFSAPHYCGTFDNAGAVMSVSEKMRITFTVHRPASRDIRRRMGLERSEAKEESI